MNMRRRRLQPDDTNATPEERLKHRLHEGLKSLDLSEHIIDVLEKAGILLVSDLVSLRPEQLLDIDNLGEKDVNRVLSAFNGIGKDTSGTRAKIKEIIESRQADR